MQRLRDRLIDLREEKNLSQTKVATIIQTSQQQYSKYESGESELPVRALVSLAQFYNVSADYILGLNDYKKSNGALNRKLLGDKSVGAMVTDIMSLSDPSRVAIAEQIEMRKLKEAAEAKRG